MKLISRTHAELLTAAVSTRLVRHSHACLQLERCAHKYEKAGELTLAEQIYKARRRTAERMTNLYSLLKELQSV